MKDELDPLYAGAKRLRGKVCIVTGAGQGIGRAAAKRLGAEGGRIVVADWTEKAAFATAEHLKRNGVEAVAAIVDVGKLAGAEQLMQQAVSAFGRIDVLVNNVGGTIWWQPYTQYSEEQIELELARSLYPTLWCCKAVLPYMIEQKSGAIVNVSSIAGAKGALYRAPYAASKGGVDALTKTLAAENGRHKIRVNAVAPGVTAIPDRVTSRLVLEPGREADAAPGTEALMKETRQIALGALERQGSVEEQAAVIAFLASEDAGYITGSIIECAGG